MSIDVLLTYPKFRATNDSGTALVGGKLYTYIAGTTTNKATYSDYNLATANTNPVVLDRRGEAAVYGSGAYKFVLKDSAGNTVWSVDNLTVNVVAPSATAESDFIVSGASPFAWLKKTLAQVKTILGLLLTQTSEAVGFTIAGGTTSKTLTVSENTNLDEAVAMSSKAPKASPTFTTQITTPQIVAPSASLIIKPTTDAQTAVQIVDAAGYEILRVDTSNRRVLLKVANTVIAESNSEVPLGNLHVFTADAQAANKGGNLIFGGCSNNAATLSATFGAVAGVKENSTPASVAGKLIFLTTSGTDGLVHERAYITSTGLFGIGMTPSVQFELSGAVGQKASGTAWSNPSDIRLKENITLADLDRCYEIIKDIPLKRYTLKTEAFSVEQAKDRSKLGWIADDVMPFFPKAVPNATFSLVPVPDGDEEYEEQDFMMETVEKEEVSIEMREGQPVQVKRVVKSKEKVLLFDEMQVIDESGNKIFQTDKEGIEYPVMFRIPVMIKKTRPKFKQNTIEECKSLDSDQLFAAMYGCIQKLMAKVEVLEQQYISGTYEAA